MTIINSADYYGSLFGIGDDQIVYAKGNNKYGKLGCKSNEENVEDWSPVTIEGINKLTCNTDNIIDILGNSEIEKDYFIFKVDDKRYFSGKFGNKNYNTIIDLDKLIDNLYPIKRLNVRDSKHVYNQNYFNTINGMREQEIPLFKATKDDVLCIELNIYTPNDVISLTITGDYRRGIKIYNEYAILPKNNIDIVVRESESHLIFCVRIHFSEVDRILQENNIRISYYVNSLFDNISIDELDIQNSEVFKELEYNQSDIGYFGDETDSHIVEIPTTNTKYKMIDINIDIGEINSILKDDDIGENEYVDKKIIPYEDENYKGPQFLYPIFYNTGMPFNKFVPFEGMITKDGTEYLISHVRISNSINLEGNNGVIQFLLSPETKFIDNDIPVYSNNTINESENFRLFAITFYPIIDNGSGELVYQVIDNIPNSIVTQEKGLLNIPIEIKPKMNLDTSNSVNEINARVIKRSDDKYVMICLGNKIGKTETFVYLLDITSGEVIKEIEIKPDTTFNVVRKDDENVFALIYTNENNTKSNVLISPNDGSLIDDTVYEYTDIDETYNLYKIDVDESKIYEYNTPKGKKYQCGKNFCYINKIQNTDIEFTIEFNSSISYNNGDSCMMKILSDKPGVINYSTSDTTNVFVMPSVVQSLDGIMMINESIIREGFPKPFTIK